MILLRTSWWVVIGFILGCQNDHTFNELQKEDKIFSIPAFRTSRATHLSISSAEQVAGSGQLIFIDPLTGIMRPSLFHLKFYLENAASQIEFVFYMASTQWKEGLSLEFRRNPEWQVWIHQSGGRSYNITSYITEKDMSLLLQFRVAVSLDSLGTRVLIWDHRPQELTVDNVIFNSRLEGLILHPKLMGPSWGIKFNQALILQAKPSVFYVL